MYLRAKKRRGGDAFTRELTFLVVAIAVIIAQKLSTKPCSEFPKGSSIPEGHEMVHTENSLTIEDSTSDNACSWPI